MMKRWALIFLVLGELVRNDVDRPGLLGRWRDKKP